MKNLLCLLTLATLISCNELKTVETTEGNMTDRYTVDSKGEKHGEFRRFFGKDTLAELSFYDHGKLTGERTIYNVNGKPEITEMYVNDTLHGDYKVFFEDGKVKIEGKYTNGVMEGVWKRYYPNGTLFEEVTFAENEENGPFTEYHENGKLAAKGQYKGGDFEHDSLYLYTENGELMRKMFCQQGVCRTAWVDESLIPAQDTVQTPQ
jgi:antitoxin component YwqK of YwqJK toxin-antitoxin module